MLSSRSASPWSPPCLDRARFRPGPRALKADLEGWGGAAGDGPDPFSTPHVVVALPDGSVLVADRQNQRVERLSAGGAALDVWPAGGDVGGLTVAPDKPSVYAAEVLNWRVQVPRAP